MADPIDKNEELFLVGDKTIVHKSTLSVLEIILGSGENLEATLQVKGGTLQEGYTFPGKGTLIVVVSLNHPSVILSDHFFIVRETGFFDDRNSWNNAYVQLKQDLEKEFGTQCTLQQNYAGTTILLCKHVM